MIGDNSENNKPIISGESAFLATAGPRFKLPICGFLSILQFSFTRPSTSDLSKIYDFFDFSV